jgi:hypothetical protein
MSNYAQNTFSRETVREEYTKARRGGESSRSWTCCKCLYVNKSGKFSICSNPKTEQCGGSYTYDQQKQRPKEEQFLNHKRCDDECRPYYNVDTEDGRERSWPNRPMDKYDIEIMNELAHGEIEQTSERQIGSAVRNMTAKSQHVIERDSLTYQIIDKNKLDPRTPSKPEKDGA